MVESRYFTRPAAQPSTSVYEEETRLRKSLVPTTSYVVVEFLPTSTVVFSGLSGGVATQIRGG